MTEFTTNAATDSDTRPHSHSELADTVSRLIDIHNLIEANFQNPHMVGGIRLLLNETDKTLADLLNQYSELAKSEGGEQ